MHILDNILSGLQQIRYHKLRSALTLLGIILGTMALITMFSLVDGIKVLVLDGFSQMGYDGVVFVTEANPGDRKEAVRFARHGLRMLDLPFLLGNETQFAGIAPVIEWRTGALFEGAPRQETFRGVTEQYFLVRNKPVCVGRSLTPLDIERCHGVCVLGRLLSDDVYDSPEKAVGRFISMDGARVEVVGVLAYNENNFVQDGDVEREQESVYLPITFVMKNFTGNDDIHYMVMKVENTDRLDEAYLEIQHLFKRAHNSVEDVRIENVAEEILRVRDFLDEILRNWTIIGGSIGGVSLLVGGIGVLSILLISISERTFEIGLRKAVGASDGEVFLLLLTESLTLCTIGAAIGCILGAVVVHFAEKAFEFDLIVSRSGMGLTVLFAVITGTAFGFYPSWKAFRMEPVQALKGL